MSASVQQSAAHEARLSRDVPRIRDTSTEDPEAIATTDEKAAPDVPAEVPILERWNDSRVNVYRFLVTLYSFVVMGMNDGAVGVSSSPSRGSNLKSKPLTLRVGPDPLCEHLGSLWESVTFPAHD